MNLREEMESLNQLVLKMSDAVVTNITEAINYYLEKCDHVEINDDLIDQYERLVEEMCVNILLKERPFAKDLKEVTGVLKLVSDLERIGDHAEDIYDFATKLIGYKEKEEKNTEIENLSVFVMQMINRAIKAYIEKDYNLAKEVIAYDDYVDEKYLEIIGNLRNKENIDKDYLSFAIYTTLVVKYLERIADHSVNIAEWVVYISSGYYKDKMIF
ncbi:MAG TPA: phosphate transport system regulatory protein PhoU [Acholeplasmatales bacterium]|nr:phosphate transport system regulatory protein PhoU [Acholeplasmatales bacterium]